MSTIGKRTRQPIEARKRAVAAYKQIMAEAVRGGTAYRKRGPPSAHPEVALLAEAYGITTSTLRSWVKDPENA